MKSKRLSFVVPARFSRGWSVRGHWKSDTRLTLVGCREPVRTESKSHPFIARSPLSPHSALLGLSALNPPQLYLEDRRCHGPE